MYIKPVDFDGDVNLFHFVLLRCVGKGAFGKVCLIKCLKTTSNYLNISFILGPRRTTQTDQRAIRS